MLQLDPPIPMNTPKGSGFAYLVIDYGLDYDLCWTVFLTKSKECWSFQNRDIRAVDNITFKRNKS
jgi:hypothetical protein